MVNGNTLLLDKGFYDHVQQTTQLTFTMVRVFSIYTCNKNKPEIKHTKKNHIECRLGEKQISDSE